jgi:S-DNA-T family DNA segregation ATPase FtsK/SpoIIIE
MSRAVTADKRGQLATKKPRHLGDVFVDLLMYAVVAVARLIAWLLTKPIIWVPAGAFTGLAYWQGPVTAGVGVGVAALALVGWRFAHHASFGLLVGRPAYRTWRRWWGYTVRWQRGTVACGLSVEDRVPRIRKVKQMTWGERVLVTLPAGLAPEDVRKKTPQLAWTFGQRKACRVKVEDDRVWLEFSNGRALRETIPALPIPHTLDLTAVGIGKREDGQPWKLQLLDPDPERGYKHLFIAGMTGSGKSKVLWGIVRQLAPGLHDGSVELWVVDGKEGVEFGPAEPLCRRFAGDETKPMAVLLNDAVKRMQAQGKQMRAMGISQHVPSPEFPVIVLFVDEVSTLIADNPDTNEAKAMERDLRLLLRLGRALGCLVIASTQDPSVENFKLRKFFFTAIGLRLKAANQVNMVYGPGSREAGALCDQLTLPGEAFVMEEDVAEAVYVRSAFVSQEDRDEVVRDYALDGANLDELALAQEFDVRPASKP